MKKFNYTILLLVLLFSSNLFSQEIIQGYISLVEHDSCIEIRLEKGNSSIYYWDSRVNDELNTVNNRNYTSLKEGYINNVSLYYTAKNKETNRFETVENEINLILKGKKIVPNIIDEKKEFLVDSYKLIRNFGGIASMNGGFFILKEPNTKFNIIERGFDDVKEKIIIGVIYFNNNHEETFKGGLLHNVDCEYVNNFDPKILQKENKCVWIDFTSVKNNKHYCW